MSTTIGNEDIVLSMIDMVRLARKLQEITNELEELQKEVEKLVRAVKKNWMGDEDARNLLAEKNRYDEVLKVKEQEKVQMEKEFEALVTKMKEIGLYNDKVGKILKLYSILSLNFKNMSTKIADEELVLSMIEVARKLQKTQEEFEELQKEVAKLVRAVNKNWMGEEDARNLLIEKNRYEEAKKIKEQEKVQMEEELVALVTKMREIGLYNDEEEKIVNSIIGKNVTYTRKSQYPLKSSLAKAKTRQKMTKHVCFNLDESKVYFI